MRKPLVSSAMLQQIEDFAGRLFMLVWFTAAVGTNTTTLIKDALQSGVTSNWLLDSARSILLLAFSALAVVLTVMRKPTKAVAPGLEPRISAILGTFLMLTLPFLPGTETGVDVKLASALVMTVGVALSIYCLFWLGRSWSIMATARNLVTKGPYSVVRHPLYASEMITMAGLALGYFSLTALVVFLATLGFTLRRTYNEERVLRSAFPEYEEYARRVPRIIPRLRLPKGGEPARSPAAFTPQP